ncbi:HEAT repeat domain-containing protein [Alienimonas californiensis]|uniref:HEAT repeat protein n=1 Tax=Alienimonas californiensis TaxID=2527989 RepID=A0A517P8B1_9PLAN|nr:HEAT repeat domain-containing protein [Alienimonas californiensis]QDT15602.1 hypothetical protein CA12_16870 [Alienimonas californiensis]
MANATPPPALELARTVVRAGPHSAEGVAALKALKACGPAAVDAVVEVLADPPPTPDRHPRDVWEDRGLLLWSLAKRPDCEDAILDRLAAGSLSEQDTVQALGVMSGRRSLEALIELLNADEPWVRQCAVRALQRRNGEPAPALATPALIDSLRDRSVLVKENVVSAMLSRAAFRTPAALQNLRRLRASDAFRQRHSHSWTKAGRVIELIEADAAGD